MPGSGATRLTTRRRILAVLAVFLLLPFATAQEVHSDDDLRGRPAAGLPSAPPAAAAEPAQPRMIVGFQPGARGWSARGEGYGGTLAASDEALGFAVYKVSDPKEFARRAHADPAVRYVEPDGTMQALYVPNDPSFSSQYGPQDVGAVAAWNSSRGTTSAAVCVVDTGVRYTHEDLNGTRWKGGYDFVNSDADPMDDNGHGTHVAGTAAATLNNSKGIAGMGNVALYGVKVLDASGSGSWSAIASGIRWCADNTMNRTVISMSLGGSSSTITVHEAVQYAVGKGRLVVAAAGNSGPCANCVGYPAAYPEVLAVGCTTAARTLCSFSSRGPEVDISAPGYGILSAWHTSDTAYNTISGTSMSTPHVSGAAALIWSAYTNLTAADLRIKLEETARDMGTAGRFGAGYVFGGAGQSITVPRAGVAMPNGTVMMWVYPTSRAPEQGRLFFHQHPGVVNQLVLVMDTDGRVRFQTGNTDNLSFATAASLPLDAWSHVAVTWSPTGQRIYLNGNLAANRTDGTPVGADYTHTMIGNSPNDANTGGFLGRVDEVREYPVVLNQSTIQSLKDLPYAGPSSSPAAAPRLLGNEIFALQMDADDHGAPVAGRTRDSAPGALHGYLNGVSPTGPADPSFGKGEMDVAAAIRPNRPGAVRDLNVTYVGSRVEVAWAPPALQGGVIGSYQVHRSVNNSTVLLATVNGTTLGYADNACANVTLCQYSVRAVNLYGPGTASSFRLPSANRAPVLGTLSCAPAPAMMGDPVTCALDVRDDSLGVANNVTWGDGTWTRLPAGGYGAPAPLLLSHVYATGGNRTVTVKVVDTGGLQSTRTATAAVATADDCGTGVDAGGAFANATPLALPVAACAGALRGGDTSDYFLVNLTAGQTLHVNMTPPSGADFDLCVLRPDGTSTACSTAGGSASESIAQEVSETGAWRIRVYVYSGNGTYAMDAAATSPPLPDAAPQMRSITCVDNPARAGDTTTCLFRAADDSTGVYYAVQWGDGSSQRVPASGYVRPGSTQSATHTWAAAGSFTVAVTATDSAGQPSASIETTQFVDP